MTDDLIAFLKARLDEDEAAAKAVLGAGEYEADWHEQSSGVLYVGPGTSEHPLDGLQPMGDSRLTRFIARHDPARVLREVEAKRVITRGICAALPLLPEAEPAYADALFHVLRTLYAIYSDHPDYREEWKP